MISRQVLRQLTRNATKLERNSERLQPTRMNKARQQLLHGMSVAMAEHFEPSKAFKKMSDIVTYKAEQLHLAHELNSEFIERSNGKAGKKPRNVQFIKPVALAIHRTNPIGHFA